MAPLPGIRFESCSLFGKELGLTSLDDSWFREFIAIGIFLQLV